MKLLLSVSLLHLNLAIQRRSALTSRTTHHPFSNILTLIALHACRFLQTASNEKVVPPPSKAGKNTSALLVSSAKSVPRGRPTTPSALHSDGVPLPICRWQTGMIGFATPQQINTIGARRPETSHFQFATKKRGTVKNNAIPVIYRV